MKKLSDIERVWETQQQVRVWNTGREIFKRSDVVSGCQYWEFDLLENMIYWELRRRGRNLYYWNEGNGECDFVVCKGKVPEQLIQVCYELNAENQEREVKGLAEAMKSLKIDRGLIVTYDQTDLIKDRDKRIDVVPASVFLK